MSEHHVLTHQRDVLLAACEEVLGRIEHHPAYAELTLDEQERIGGDTAELAYLASVLREAIERVQP